LKSNRSLQKEEKIEEHKLNKQKYKIKEKIYKQYEFKIFYVKDVANWSKHK